jgi:molybdenum cofactor cytidylyltransferase
MTTGIILLAAGHSARFGSDKRCAPWPGNKCMLKASIENAVNSGLPCYVVLHPGDQHILEHCIEDGAEAGICPDANLGIGHSISYGVHANQEWDGWIIARADMPWVTPEVYQKLATHLQSSDYARPIDKSGQPGFPTALRREHAFELMHLKGHRTEVRIIPDQRNVNVFIDHDMIHHDVTVPTDIPRLA